MTELHYRSLSDVCRQLKSGELSSVEVTKHQLQRIEALEPTLKSMAMVIAEAALERAAELDSARDRGEPMGALHGVPIGVKDLLFTEGLVTASGTKVMANFVPDHDATVVAKLKAAGAVIVGKTQLTEGAFGAHHPSIECPRNPYNHEHWPGVSSSGSGASVAAGLVFGALGSDTGGSIRFPSASCGLVGIKPTYGRVSRFGAFPLSETLDHIGPMTRTVEDAARMLAVIAGQDSNDSTSLDAPVPNYMDCSDDIRGLRIGVDWRYASMGVRDEVVSGTRDAVAALEALGAEVVEIEIPADYKTLVEEWGITCGVDCAKAHAGLFPEQAALYGPSLARLLELGLNVDRTRYNELEVIRANFRQALDEILGRVDMIAAPCMTTLPPTIAEMEAEGGFDEPDLAPFITFTAPFDYSGHPTITLPIGQHESGLPLSFQLVGRYLEEGTLIRAGLAFERQVGAMPHPKEPHP